MKVLIISITVALVLTACGIGSSNTANNSNSRSSNSSANGSSSNPVNTPAAVLEPTTMAAYDLVGSYQKENEGRIVTVTGGQLEEIGYSSLRIGTISGSFECGGDFAEYQSMKTRIDDLRYKHQSPTVTVKGIYTTSSYSNDKPALRNCILTDLKR